MEEQKKPSMWEQHRAKYGCECSPKTGSCQKPKTQVAALSGFDPEVLKVLGQTIALGVVEGMKAAEKEKTKFKDDQTQRHRKRMQAQLVETRKNEIAKWQRCTHMRAHPYSGTSRIAWATQSDGVTRGTCMGCACPFSPIADELPEPFMVEWYKRMISVPMTAAQNDFVTGMVAAGSPA
jgi:hypothetical protein